MPKINDSEKAFLTKIQALYDIEGQLEKTLPKMAKAAKDPELKKGFTLHLEETKNHIKRLEQIFKTLNSKPKKLTVEGVRGIIEDGNWVIKEVEALPQIKDSLIAGAARYAEHYEMAGYMTAIIMAKALGLNSAVSLLNDTLKEEESADASLTRVVIKYS